MKFDAKAARSLEHSYGTPDIAHQRQRTLKVLELDAGGHVLDVGCGPGFLTEGMAAQVGPRGRVLGLDASPHVLELATARCAGLSQVTLTEGRIQDIPEDDATFDAAACTQLLLFIEDVPQALGELHRVLKPGGRMAILGTDWRGLVLASDDDALTRRLFTFWDSKAASPNLPVHLGPMLRDAGFTIAHVEAIPIVNTRFTEDNYSSSFLRGLAKKAAKAGVISDQVATDWIDEMKRRDDDGAYFFCINRFLFTAIKN